MAKENITDAQEQFINLILSHRDLAADYVGSNLKVLHFDQNYKIILRAVERSLEDGDSVLTRKTFVDFAKRFAVSDAEFSAQLFLFDKIGILDVDRGDFILLKQRIMESHVLRNAINYIDEFRQNLESEGGIVAAKKLAEKMSGLTIDATVENKIIYESTEVYAGQYYDMFKKRREMGDELDKRIVKCGIKEIDDAIVVGFCPGSLTLFCADIANFKTTVMLNAGYNVFQRGFNVLIVPLEMPRDKMYQKLLSRMSGVPFDRIEYPKCLTNDELKKIEEQTQYLMKPKPNQLYIMEGFERIPVSKITREVEKHIDIFKPDLVVIDYIANLTAEERYKNIRLDAQIGEMLKDLRTAGKPGAIHEKGFGIITAAQLGREGLKRFRKEGASKATFHSEDVRQSHDYAADSDNIFAQMKDPSQPNRRLIFYIVKARYGKTTFANGESKATLEVIPEISLVQSIQDDWLNGNSSSILAKTREVEAKKEDVSSATKEATKNPSNTPIPVFPISEELPI